MAKSKAEMTRADRDRVTLYLSIAAGRRLRTHSVMLGVDMSDLVERLIMEHLNEYEIVPVVKPRAPEK